ncbi:TPA: hypothetical protein I7264_26065 [Vibrio parahaemolyticus]|nr:hypothetical protein [Vibrio parahaemolyticus]HAS6625722.1 hypothetical protein [Vibrio parahaemolyticus]HAS6636256.1 hypothetical protein [Vibrio parahaemolyticus]HAS6652754.1 hypothetical protein [Vibrio parahaemolyticus]HAS6658110.1 hypothetical protein [Vibrio parahaemolyticus]
MKIVVRFLFWLDFPFQKPVYMLKVSSVTLFVQRLFLVLLALFLRRCMFQVVSVRDALKLRLILVFQST